MELSDWLVDHLWGLFVYRLWGYSQIVCELSVGVRPAPVYACHKFAVSVFLIASKTHLNAF